MMKKEKWNLSGYEICFWFFLNVVNNMGFTITEFFCILSIERRMRENSKLVNVSLVLLRAKFYIVLSLWRKICSSDAINQVPIPASSNCILKSWDMKKTVLKHIYWRDYSSDSFEIIWTQYLTVPNFSWITQ